MATATNSSTGAGYPYPNTLTLDAWVSASGDNYDTISWKVTVTGGATNYWQQYFNALAAYNDGSEHLIWGSGATGQGWQDAVVAEGSFTIYHTEAKTISLKVGGGFNSSANYTEGSTSISLSAKYRKPSKPTVSGSNNGSFSNKITYGESDFGYPASGTVYLYGGTSNNPTTQIASKTSTGNSTFTHNNLRPNTVYYYRVRAHNGNQWSDYSDVITVKTKPAALVPYPNDPEQSNTAKYVKKIEVPLNGLARNATKLYRSVGGVAQRIY